MNITTFFRQLARWHYQAGLAALWRHAVNLPRLVWRLTAPTQILARLFVPWRRLHESYPDDLSFEQAAGTFIVNTLMRLVGAVVRLALLVVGMLIFVLTLVLAGILLVGWMLLPAVIGALFVGGITALF